MSNAPGDQKDHPAVVIRPPLIQRVFVLVFFLVWCGAVATGFVVAVAHGSPAAIFLAIMLAFGATLGYRMLRMCVEVHGNELLVRTSPAPSGSAVQTSRA